VFKDGKEVQREEGELQAQELRILLKHYGVFREIKQTLRLLYLANVQENLYHVQSHPYITWIR
jgi:hypothetical protein